MFNDEKSQSICNKIMVPNNGCILFKAQYVVDKHSIQNWQATATIQAQLLG